MFTCTPASLPSMPQRPGVLVPVLFHSLYPGRDELADGSLAPNQDITVQVFRSFVLEMLEAGYTAVTPAQVDAGLDAQARYFMVTFDDGYFNNILALDVLREFRVPATFFISTGHVRDGKSFWWDALGRQLTSAGITGVTQRREIERVKQWTSREIESWLLGRFGDRALEPCGDLDRPFTVQELQAFAANPWVHLGNHTVDRAATGLYRHPQALAAAARWGPDDHRALPLSRVAGRAAAMRVVWHPCRSQPLAAPGSSCGLLTRPRTRMWRAP